MLLLYIICLGEEGGVDLEGWLYILVRTTSTGFITITVTKEEVKEHSISTHIQ